MPIIPVTQEEEIGKIIVGSQTRPKEKVRETQSQQTGWV
jgi:hypothetical protein